MAPRGAAQAVQKLHKRQRRTSAHNDGRVPGYPSDSSEEDERAYACPGPSNTPRATSGHAATHTDKSWKQRRLQKKSAQAQQRASLDRGGDGDPTLGDAEEDYWDKIARPSAEGRAAHTKQEEVTDAGAMQSSTGGYEHPSDLEGASDFSDCEERSAYIAARRSKREVERNLARKEELAARRMERMKALVEREAHSVDHEHHGHNRAGLGEITEDHIELMTRTAIALRGTTNPQQLTARILANHGQDAKFAFLKSGRQPQDDAWALTSVWTRLLKGERVTWADVEAEKSRRQAALCTDGQREVNVHKLEGLISGYDSSDSDSDATDQAEVKAETSRSIGVSDEVVCPTTGDSDNIHIAHRVNDAAGAQDAFLAVSPKQGKAAALALAADGPEGGKLSDRIIRARQWAAERRKMTEGRSVTEAPDATARAQHPAGGAGDVRDVDMAVKAPDASIHEGSARQCVGLISKDPPVEATQRGRGGRGDLSAKGQKAGEGAFEGADAADDDVLDLDAEDAAAASRTMEEWQAEEVCFTIG